MWWCFEGGCITEAVPAEFVAVKAENEDEAYDKLRTAIACSDRPKPKDWCRTDWEGEVSHLFINEDLQNIVEHVIENSWLTRDEFKNYAAVTPALYNFESKRSYFYDELSARALDEAEHGPLTKFEPAMHTDNPNWGVF